MKKLRYIRIKKKENICYNKNVYKKNYQRYTNDYFI